jgi:hypothetical protein
MMDRSCPYPSSMPSACVRATKALAASDVSSKNRRRSAAGCAGARWRLGPDIRQRSWVPGGARGEGRSGADPDLRWGLRGARYTRDGRQGSCRARCRKQAAPDSIDRCVWRCRHEPDVRRGLLSIGEQVRTRIGEHKPPDVPVDAQGETPPCTEGEQGESVPALPTPAVIGPVAFELGSHVVIPLRGSVGIVPQLAHRHRNHPTMFR